MYMYKHIEKISLVGGRFYPGGGDNLLGYSLWGEFVLGGNFRGEDLSMTPD